MTAQPPRHPQQLGTDETRTMGTELRITDYALARLAAHIVRSTPGVARLQPHLTRRAGTIARNLLNARTQTIDAAAVSVTHTDDGGIDIAVRLVTYLHPPPIDVLRSLERRLVDEVSAMTGAHVSTNLIITAVS